MQRNWIGRSTGVNLRFKLENHDALIEVYTTRPDTLFGATYMVLSPEHPLVETSTTDGNRKIVEDYTRRRASLKSDLERTDLSKDKTGVFHRLLRYQPGEWRKGARMGGRLRPHLLRNRGHHGGSRP